MKDFTIQYDHRENNIWTFPPWVKMEKIYLPTADYRVKDDILSIERKNPEDFIVSISSGWKRLQAEVERMSYMPAKIFIVESSLMNFYYQKINGEIIPPEHLENHYRLTPQFITRQLSLLILRGVCVLFAENSEIASAIAYKILEERYNDITRKNN